MWIALAPESMCLNLTFSHRDIPVEFCSIHYAMSCWLLMSWCMFSQLSFAALIILWKWLIDLCFLTKSVCCHHCYLRIMKIYLVVLLFFPWWLSLVLAWSKTSWLQWVEVVTRWYPLCLRVQLFQQGNENFLLELHLLQGYVKYWYYLNGIFT